MDHSESEECDEELVEAQKGVAVSTAETHTHGTALLYLVAFALH